MTDAVPTQRVPVGPEGTECPCVRDHNPEPVEDEIHHLVPIGRPFGGADVKENRRRLCGTAHGSVHVLLRLQLTARSSSGKVPRDRLVRFSPFTKRLALIALAALDGLADRPRDVDLEWIGHTWRAP